jgi:hypothetical protein
MASYLTKVNWLVEPSWHAMPEKQLLRWQYLGHRSLAIGKPIDPSLAIFTCSLSGDYLCSTAMVVRHSIRTATPLVHGYEILGLNISK